MLERSGEDLLRGANPGVPSPVKHQASHVSEFDQPPTFTEAGEISGAPVPVGNAVIGGARSFYLLLLLYRGVNGLGTSHVEALAVLDVESTPPASSSDRG